MPRRQPLALIGVLAVLVLPACGGEEAPSADEYEEQTEAALQTILDLDELSAPLANPESVDQYVTGVREIAAKIEGSVDELKGIDPPQDVASLHEELVTAVESYGAAFAPVADAAEARDEEALQSSAEELKAAAAAFQETGAQLDEQFRDEGIELDNLL